MNSSIRSSRSLSIPMSGSRRKRAITFVPVPKHITDADWQQRGPMSSGLTCVKRSMPMLPGTPEPIPGSSKRSQRKTPLSSPSLPKPS